MNGLGLEILYQDEHCLAVNKPPGVLTQAPPGIDSLEVRVRAWLQRRRAKTNQQLPDRQNPGAERKKLESDLILTINRQSSPSEAEGKYSECGLPKQIPEAETPQPGTKKLYLGVPHRLDRPVSGVVLFALTRRAAQRLSAQFEQRTIKKLYWACVEGRVEPTEGTWKDFLRKTPGQPRAEMVPMEHPEALYAALQYRVLAYLEWGTWLEIRLDTGRYHQIRIQSASRGHPVLGDGQYGAQQPFGPPGQDQRLQPIALHARTLIFRHPKSKETMIIRAPLPECWKELLLPESPPYPDADLPCNPWEEVF